MANAYSTHEWTLFADFVRIAPDDIARGPSPAPMPPMQTNHTYTGTTANNTISGTAGADTFNMFQGGADTCYGKGGNDIFNFGAKFGPNDAIHGGPGTDTLNLSGAAYAGGLTITKSMLQGVEDIGVAPGNSYAFTIGSGVIGNDTNIFFNGSELASPNSLSVDAGVLTKPIDFWGGHGNDTFIGGSGNDIFASAQDPSTTSAGNDTVQCGGGNDIVRFFQDFNSADHVDGGDGGDALSLYGDYSAGLTITPSMVTNIEQIAFGSPADSDEKLTIGNLSISPGTFFSIYGGTMDAAHSFTFDGSAETNVGMVIYGGAGNDSLTGGSQGDTFDLSNGGKDTAFGGDGDDTFDFIDGGFDALDRLRGGSGVYDTVEIGGHDYSLTLTGTMLKGIERFHMSGHYNFTLTTTDNLLSNVATMLIAADPDVHRLVFDGSAETDASFTVNGGGGNDVLTGGTQYDSLEGNGGADTLNGGGGFTDFIYQGSTGATDSTSIHYDTIVGFDAAHDRVLDFVGVSAVHHRVNAGALSTATFDGDLAAAIDSSILGSHYAVVFKPDSGDLAGKFFLVIDVNGTAGYQGGEDLVIHLDNPQNINTLTPSNFNA